MTAVASPVALSDRRIDGARRYEAALEALTRAARRYIEAKGRRDPGLARYRDEVSRAKQAYEAIINETG